MSIDIRCGNCDAPYSVPDTLLGKKIKCKSCGEAVAVVVAAAKPVAKASKPAVIVADDDDDRRPMPRKGKMAAAFAEDDDDDRSRGRNGRGASPAKKKSALPLILVGLLGLIVVGGGAVAAVVFSGVMDEKREVANGPVWTPPDMGKMMAEKDKFGNPDERIAKKDEPKSDSTKTEERTDKVEPKAETTPTEGEPANPDEPMKKKKNLLPVPVMPPNISLGAGINTAPPSGKTAPDQATLDRAKSAAVFFEVEGNEGSISWGSGWFGVEENLIITNAHVLSMLSPTSPKPKKISVYVNPGTEKERIIAHSKLEILAVDRYADLAVIRVLNEKDLPTPLKVRMSSELRDLEPLVILGYPGGRLTSNINGHSRAPRVTVSTTNFQTLTTDIEGNLYAVQYRGGAGQGNSGGPMVDMDGNVIGIIVRGPSDRQFSAFIGYGVPTEFVTGVLAGRVSDVEYGQAFRKDGKVHIPVTANIIDPFQRMKSVSIAAWIGEPSKKTRASGKEHITDPGDADFSELNLDYKWTKEKQTASGTVTLPELPSGRAYWSQPYFRNALVDKYHLSGKPVKLSGPPVDLLESDLVMRYKIGSRRAVTINTSSDIEEFEVGEDDAREKTLLERELKAFETVEKSGDSNAAFQLRLNYDKFGLRAPGDDGEKEDISSKVMPKALLAELNKNIKLVQGFGYVNKVGEVYKTLTDTRAMANGQVNPLIAAVLKSFSDQSVETLANASVQLPNGRVKPNDTWTVNKDVRLSIRYATEAPPPMGGTPPEPGTQQPKVGVRVNEYKYMESVTYKYVGTRVRLGQKEAVVEVRGVIKPAAGTRAGSATGTVKGYAAIDLDTGTLLVSELNKEFQVDSSSDGIKKVIAGVFNYKVTRGSAVN